MKTDGVILGAGAVLPCGQYEWICSVLHQTSADHTETQSDAGSSKAGESSDTESKPTEGVSHPEST